MGTVEISIVSFILFVITAILAVINLGIQLFFKRKTWVILNGIHDNEIIGPFGSFKDAEIYSNEKGVYPAIRVLTK